MLLTWLPQGCSHLLLTISLVMISLAVLESDSSTSEPVLTFSADVLRQALVLMTLNSRVLLMLLLMKELNHKSLRVNLKQK